MPKTDRPSNELLDAYRAGSESAAGEMFDRYVDRLTQLARARLSAKLARRVDADDVVQSAYRSFFIAARGDRFALQASGDLWKLLARITLHKLYRQAAHHTADKRTMQREQPVTEDRGNSEPSPEEAVALADQIEDLMRRLDPLTRQVLELRLQGRSTREIADEIDKTDRTVRRMLGTIRRLIDGAEIEPADDVEEVERIATSHFQQHGELQLRDYRLQQLIGSGATGKVYRSIETATGETVAVKFLMKEVLHRPAVVRRFVAEAGIVRCLDHPGIVGIAGIGRTPIGGFFHVQDWVDGPSLARFAVDDSTDWQLAAGWIVDAAGALQFAHENGVTHCDVKPANLLLGADGKVRLTDFGLAQQVSLTHSIRDGIGGTVGYLAPEQIDETRGRIGPRTDLFGLGATLFALLTGRPPVIGDSMSDILDQLMSDEPLPSVGALRPDLPVAAVAVVDRCLEKHPNDRFASAAELMAALAPFGE